MSKRGPKKNTENWSVESAHYVFRKPFIKKNKWVCNRRNKLTGKVSQLTLQTLVTRTKGNGVTAARREVHELAANDTLDFEAGRSDSQVSRSLKEITFGDILDKWIVTLEVAPNTLQTYTRDVEHYKKLLGPQTKVREITFGILMDLFSIHWRGRTGRTKIKHLGLLKRIFEFAIDLGVVEHNPASRIRIQKKWRDELNAGSEVGQALTIKEGRKLIAACQAKYVTSFRPDVKGAKETEVTPPDSLFLFIFISLRTGLRMGNILPTEHKPGLLWGHVDIDKGMIHIPRELMKNRIPLNVPMHDELWSVLKERVKAIGGIPSPSETIVPPVRDIRKSFRSVMVRAGLATKSKKWEDSIFTGELADKLNPRNFRIHDLRHSACAWIDDSTSFTTAKILKGDSMRASDTRYLRHKSAEDLRKQINMVPDLKIN